MGPVDPNHGHTRENSHPSPHAARGGRNFHSTLQWENPGETSRSSPMGVLGIKNQGYPGEPSFLSPGSAHHRAGTPLMGQLVSPQSPPTQLRSEVTLSLWLGPMITLCPPPAPFKWFRLKRQEKEPLKPKPSVRPHPTSPLHILLLAPCSPNHTDLPPVPGKCQVHPQLRIFLSASQGWFLLTSQVLARRPLYETAASII